MFLSRCQMKRKHARLRVPYAYFIEGKGHNLSVYAARKHEPFFGFQAGKCARKLFAPVGKGRLADEAGVAAECKVRRALVLLVVKHSAVPPNRDDELRLF